MRPLAFVPVPFLVAAALACGSVKDRPGCSGSSGCPAGQTCVATGDGNVCWADAAPPAVASVTASCGAAPCVRDGTLTVGARVTDDREVGAVEVSLDLDGHVLRVPLARSTRPADPADAYAAQVQLGEWPFSAFERDVVARVTARDGARNEVSSDASPVAVTRVRWSVPLETGSVVVPTAPAIKAAGAGAVEIVVGGINGKVYFFKPDGTSARDPFTIPSASIAQPPSIGASAIWVAAGNRVFAVKPDGTGVLNGAGCDTGGAVVGPPAVSDSPAPDVAFAASAGGRVWAVAPSTAQAVDGLITKTAPYDAFTSGPALVGRDSLFAVSDPGAGAAMLRQFTYNEAFVPGATASLGQAVVSPLAIDQPSNLWSASADSTASALQATSAAGASAANVSLTASATGSVVILAGGDVAVCEEDRTLRRFSPTGTPRWATPPSLGGVGLTPLALSGGEAAFLVPTKAGTIHAVGATGTLLWSGTLASAELREGNVHTPAGASIGTAYFTSADGVLHAVAVDGRLDPAAPWPKAWHDARNTGNAQTAP